MGECLACLNQELSPPIHHFCDSNLSPKIIASPLLRNSLPRSRMMFVLVSRRTQILHKVCTHRASLSVSKPFVCIKTPISHLSLGFVVNMMMHSLLSLQTSFSQKSLMSRPLPPLSATTLYHLCRLCCTGIQNFSCSNGTWGQWKNELWKFHRKALFYHGACWTLQAHQRICVGLFS